MEIKPYYEDSQTPEEKDLVEALAYCVDDRACEIALDALYKAFFDKGHLYMNPETRAARQVQEATGCTPSLDCSDNCHLARLGMGAVKIDPV